MTIALTNAARAAIKKALRGKVVGLDAMPKADLLAAAAQHGLDVAGIIATVETLAAAMPQTVADEIEAATPAGFVAIHGNTWPLRRKLRSLGGQWDGDVKVWRVPADKAAAAQSLVTCGAVDAEDGDAAPVAAAPAAPVPADKAAKLAALLAELASGNAAPLDERRVIELIAEHAPRPETSIIRHEVTLRTASDAVVISGSVHPRLGMLTKAMGSRMGNGFAPNVFLVGPTGSGKTHAVEQVADAMGRGFYMHGAMAMSHELLGYKDANGNYHTTPFREAFEKGGVVLCDEMDSWDAAVTLAMNAALANGQCAFPDGMVKRHPDCIIVAAGNTHGTGPTAEFVGRNRLDAAFLSRFPVKIEWPRDPAIEVSLAGNHPAWARRVMAARERAAAAGLKTLIDPRHTQAGAALLDAGMAAEEVAELTYLAGLTADQRRTVEGR
jgi:hypothetical protein